MIKVIYNKVCGRCVQSEPLTSGMVGQQIHFEYSHDFDGLTLTAVFTNGKTTVDVLNPGNQCVIPHEVLDTVGTLVKVGIYAVRGNELVIPTVYATIGIVQKGADPSGDVSVDPTLPVWAQIQGIIGNLNDLSTEAKNNLVAAINEAAQTGSGSASIAMRVDGGFIQYSTDKGKTWVNLIAEADLKGDKGDKGDPGTPGKDGTSITISGIIESADDGGTNTVTFSDGSALNVKNGSKGSTGADGTDGITPHIGDNGNWYIGSTDTGNPSRGATGPQGPAGAPGKDGAGMDITGATVGQIAKITAVDESGAPTSWAPVDMPTGGSSEEMRVIKTITITADGVNSIYFNRDDNGLPFALTKRIRIRMYGAATNTGNTQTALFFRAGQTSGDASQASYPIKVNSHNGNYVFDFIWDLYSDINCWYGDYSAGRAGAIQVYRYVPSDVNNVSDITVREIKLVWQNASVFFQNGATIVVEGM